MESDFLRLLEGCDEWKAGKDGLEHHIKRHVWWAWDWMFPCGRHYLLQKWGLPCSGGHAALGEPESRMG